VIERGLTGKEKKEKKKRGGKGPVETKFLVMTSYLVRSQMPAARKSSGPSLINNPRRTTFSFAKRIADVAKGSDNAIVGSRGKKSVHKIPKALTKWGSTERKPTSAATAVVKNNTT